MADQDVIEPLELVGLGVEITGMLMGNMGWRRLETVVPRAEDQPAVLPYIVRKTFESEQGPFFVMVELAGYDGDGDLAIAAGLFQVSPNACVPIGIKVVGMGDPVAVILQFLAQDRLVSLDLGTVQVEIIIIFPDRLSFLPGGTDDGFLRIVDRPAAHDVLAEQPGPETGDVPVHSVVAQIHGLDLLRNHICHQPACQGRVRRAEDADFSAPFLSFQPSVQGDPVGPLVHIRTIEALRTALPAAVLLDISDTSACILASQRVVVAPAAKDVGRAGHDDRMRSRPLREVDPGQKVDTVAALDHFFIVRI